MKTAWAFLLLSNIVLAGETSLSSDLYMDNSDFESHNEALKNKNGQQTINALKSILPANNNEEIIHVTFEPTCGLLSSCPTSDLKLYGPGDFHQTYDKSSSGYIMRNYNDTLSGTYKWSILFNQGTGETKECNGDVYVDENYKNITIRAFDSNCQDAGTSRF